ncbi:MAG: TIGR03013 family PEP-CTERM/XrtA system glycosyltransferase [Proteobacteria bacterium]|nr:TIGR03013 family PEP-CTERM/XrtA system glycosyltransferase [Pseudomonadota bacterium]
MRVRFLSAHLYLPLAVLAVVECAAVALLARWAAGAAVSPPPPAFAVLFGLGYGIGAAALGLYSSRQRAQAAGIVVRVVLAVGASAVGVMLLGLLGPGERGAIGVWTEAFVLSVLLVGVLRVAMVKWLGDVLMRRRVLVYGAGRQAASLSRLRRRSDLRGFSIIGYVPAESDVPLVPVERILSVDATQIRALSERERIDEIVVAMDERRRQFPVRELLMCRLAGIDVTDVVTFLERETGTVRLDVLNPSWIIFSEGFRRDLLRQVTKRVFDVAAATLLLAVAWPLMILTIVAIWLEDGWHAPILYRQRRVGMEGRVFEVLKFRSMRTDAEKDGRPQWATAGDSRVTRVGSVIRTLRIDELPQILNVLRGDMSFVGPRPERPEFVADLGDRIPYFHERHFVKPGITGWAQICYPYGASERDAAEKLQYDLYYVKHHTLLFDLAILLQTVEVVLFRKGGR